MEYLLRTLERGAMEYGVELIYWKQLTVKNTPQIFKQMDIILVNYRYILQSIKYGWSKLESYYRKLDKSPVYTTLILLYLKHKSQFLKYY